MKNEKMAILKFANSICKNKINTFVSLRSIDARMILEFEEIVINGELKMLISELVEEGYLVWKNENKSAVHLSSKALSFTNES